MRFLDALVVTSTFALSLLAGCATADKPSPEADAYQALANARFDENDIRHQLYQQIAAKHRDVARLYRAAFVRGDMIVGPKLTMPTVKVTTDPDLSPPTDLWAEILVDETGAVSEVSCVSPTGELQDTPIAKSAAKLISSWRFTPMTANGKPIPCIGVFPLLGTGRNLSTTLARAF